jgi:protein-tyrosine phosphatase
VFKRILIVCVGNICRSPTAEYLFRQRLFAVDIDGSSDVLVESAGLGALVGSGMDTTALSVLAEHGVDGRSHLARQLNGDMLRAAELVLVMEKGHVAAITKAAPQASGKTFLLGKWQHDVSIPDPYRQHRIAFEHVYDLIDDAVTSWVERLN